MQRLPSLPEDTYLSHKFQVMLIGPKARGIMKKITAIAECEGPVSPSGPGSARTFASSLSTGSRRSQPRYASEEKMAYFRLEEGLSVVKFHPIEFFDDAFPSLQCWQDLREWLLVFLVDDRNGLKDEVLPELQRRRHELNFIVKSLRTKLKVSTRVPLQAMMLLHCRKGSQVIEAASECQGGSKSPSELLGSFIAGLQDITTSHKQEPFLRVIDFDDGEQLCASVAGKVREVLEWERVSTEELV